MSVLEAVVVSARPSRPEFEGSMAEGAARLPADAAMHLDKMRYAANLKNRRRKKDVAVVG